MEPEYSWVCIWEHTTSLSAQVHGPVWNCNMLLFVMRRCCCCRRRFNCLQPFLKLLYFLVVRPSWFCALWFCLFMEELLWQPSSTRLMLSWRFTARCIRMCRRVQSNCTAGVVSWPSSMLSWSSWQLSAMSIIIIPLTSNTYVCVCVFLLIINSIPSCCVCVFVLPDPFFLVRA